MDGMRRLKEVMLQTAALLEEVSEHDTHPPSSRDEAETDVTLSPAVFNLYYSHVWFQLLRRPK